MDNDHKPRKGRLPGTLAAQLTVLFMGILLAVHFLTGNTVEDEKTPVTEEKQTYRPTLELLVTSFNEFWNAGDVDGMAELFALDLREEQAQKLRTLFKLRNWQEKPPPAVMVQDGIKINEEGLGWAVMRAGRAIVTTKWRYGPSGWEAYALTLPR